MAHQALIVRVSNFLHILEEFHSNDYDDRAPIGAPWLPRKQLEDQGQQVWESYWTGVLNQFLINHAHDALEPEFRVLTQHVIEALSHNLFGLTDHVLRYSPSNLLYFHRDRLEKIFDEYTEIVNRPITGYVIWPLQLGRGTPLNFERVSLGDGIFFQGATLPNPVGPPFVDVNKLINLAMQKPYLSLIRDYPREAYLYVRVSDENTDLESALQQTRINLFLMLCALRLSCGGDIAASQACFLVDPVEILHGETQVSGDIPAPLLAHRLGTPWPKCEGQNFHKVLGSTIQIYTVLTGIKGLREDINRISIAWSSWADTLRVTVRAPFAVNQTVETWLGFALQLLEYTYTRSDLEGIIHCWAIMEALFVFADETTSTDRKLKYHSTIEKVAIRATVLDALKDQQSQQDFYNKVRVLGDTRNMVAHGKEMSQRKILLSTLSDFRDMVRRSLINVVNWVANENNDTSPSCHRAMLNSLDMLRQQVLIKSQDKYYTDYKSQS